jgi:hypothetical protein
MARVGQEMVNPVTKDRFGWRHTAESTAGEYAECDLFLEQGAVVAARHSRPALREDFRIERGAVQLQIGDVEEQLSADDEAWPASDRGTRSTPAETGAPARALPRASA